MEEGYKHISVMPEECIEALALKKDGIYVDCTLGAGGHSRRIARQLDEGGRLIAIDQDYHAIEVSQHLMRDFGSKVELVHDNFEHIEQILEGRQISKIDGALIDLGVSSGQLDTPERGFSYQHDARLDMRMNPQASLDAYAVVNGYSERELCDVLRNWGEEKFASRIARFVVEEREKKPIETTLQLVEIIKKAIPLKARETGHHPAKRSFQAIRIEVNRELDVIAPTLEALIRRLRVGGRLAVITFHSLEDRIVKQTFAKAAKGCTCPPGLPVCVCGKKPELRLVCKNPLLPGEEELEGNPRSRSAKLRVAEKIDPLTWEKNKYKVSPKE